MALNFSYWKGTNGNDYYNSFPAFSVTYGLKGDDRFDIFTAGQYQVLAGGAGNDTYNVYGSAVIYDLTGSDSIFLWNAISSNSSVATIDHGKHAVLFDYTTGNSVFLIDIKSNAYWDDTGYLLDTSMNLGVFLSNIDNISIYRGDFRWEDLDDLGFMALNTNDVNAAITAALTTEAYTQLIGDVEQIALLYEAALGREPDKGGLNFWVDVFENGQTIDQLSSAFLASNEFKQNFGNPAAMSVQQFIDTMYLNVLDRIADAGGRSFWIDQVNHGASYSDILTYFSTSAENYDQADYLATLHESQPGYWDWA